MNKVNINEFGLFLGNLLVFVSVFLPWYGINHYGNEISYTGFGLANIATEFSTIYLLPLLSGVLMSYISIAWLNRSHISAKKSQWIILIVISATILAITFFSLLICPPGGSESIINNIMIGGYAAITGSITTLFFAISYHL